MFVNVALGIGIGVFGILFAFIMLILITTIIGASKKQKRISYTPNISVVIPAYNEQNNIKSCLNSIFKSKYPLNKLEVIVVDDGSTDKTYNILKAYSKKNHNLKIIKGKHEGKSVSLNLGVKASKNEIIVTLDADAVINRDALEKLVSPFTSKKVGATNGSCLVKNKNSILGVFQNVEYHYNNLIRKSFSSVFSTGIWFYGFFAGYRKSVLKKVGYFKKDTLTEDMDIALEIYKKGYSMINVHDAFGRVLVPQTLKSLIKQRVRWWTGTLQALGKNKKLISKKSSPSILFLFLNQYWWSIYAVLSLPIIIIQYIYWLPFNNSSFISVFWYSFKWFSFLGSAQVIYMIPEWGISFYSIFGVLSGIITAGLIIYALIKFKDKLNINNLLGVFFYFPYTILLNIIILISLLKIKFINKPYFIHDENGR